MRRFVYKGHHENKKKTLCSDFEMLAVDFWPKFHQRFVCVVNSSQITTIKTRTLLKGNKRNIVVLLGALWNSLAPFYFYLKTFFLQKVYFFRILLWLFLLCSKIFLIYSNWNVSEYRIRKSKLFPVCHCCYAENGKVFPFFANIFSSLFVLHFKFGWKRL